ncbi:unnamed protein product, partial [Meganyctiphanes norvegica]
LQLKTTKGTMYYYGGITILLSLVVFMTVVAEKLPKVSVAIPLLEITILLSLTVFMTMVADKLPQVSDAIPLLATYFNCIMFMVASSVVLTVVVLNYHHRKPKTHSMPNWVRTVFLQWLPWILRMSRPGKKITRKGIILKNKMRELEMNERSSRSLLANVLDIDDDIRQIQAMTPHSSDGSFRTLVGRSFEEGALPMSQHSYCFSNSRELQNILQELRFITGKVRNGDVEHETMLDWKFAAMVIDRCCLITFTLYTAISTVVVLLQAPHVSIS